MEQAQFRKIVMSIYNAFDLKQAPAEDAMEIWFKKCQHIPEHAVSWILDNITNSETKPRNVGVAIKSAWGEWRKLNSHKIVNYTELTIISNLDRTRYE